MAKHDVDPMGDINSVADVFVLLLMIGAAFGTTVVVYKAIL